MKGLGNCSSFFIGRAKYDAWAKLKGIGKDQAMREYIALVDSVR